jgi:hypothetical protein
METSSPDGGIDRRVMNNIRFNARRLARGRTIPGMEVEDVEQDLVVDLLRRQAAFDPRLASFPTFADRIVRHRISTLGTPTLRLRCERMTTSLDAPAVDRDGTAVTLADLLADETSPVDDWVALKLDVGRFVETLPVSLVVGCEVLLADSVLAGARAAGIHRSTAYDRAMALREQAPAGGLDIYFCRPPDTRATGPVCGLERALHQGADPEATSVIKPSRVHLLVDESELLSWLSTANAGDVLEYHRGYLAMDRVPGSRLGEEARQELDRIANKLFALASSSRGHLLQRRHGNGDYTYLFVYRPSRSGDRTGMLLAPGNRS